MVKTKTTEKDIKEAAKRVFQRKGMYGARMQEIADEAGINKALLHYYFRSKEKLFEAIFQEVFQEFVPKAISIFNSGLQFEDIIKAFVSEYLDFVSARPFLPLFIVNETNHNPNLVQSISGKFQYLTSTQFFTELKQKMNEGEFRRVSPEHFIINIMSLCIFPFLARPMLLTLFQRDDTWFVQFIQERKKEIPQWVINSIRNYD